MEIFCKLCCNLKDEREFPHENGKLRRRICWTCSGRRERAKLKLDMLEALGIVCACCGESNPYFLTLDHVENDGAEHRKTLNEQQIYRQARREGWPKDRYQLLCMNCNFAKGHFGVCPHKLDITTEKAFQTLREQSETRLRSRHDYQAEYSGNQHERVVKTSGGLWKDMSEDERNSVLVQLLGRKA